MPAVLAALYLGLLGIARARIIPPTVETECGIVSGAWRLR